MTSHRPRVAADSSTLLGSAFGRSGCRRTAPVTLLTLLVVAGCASTTLTSMVNPARTPKVFTKVMVHFPLSDLGLRQTVEEEFRSHDLFDRFVPSFELLFPGQEYTPEQAREILRQHEVDAVLVISLRDAGSSTSYVPQSATTTCTLWSTSDGCTQTQTTTSGGYSVAKPWASFQSSLYDFETGEVAWTASAQTAGNKWADAEDLLRSLARKSVDRLREERLIP